jgi:gliding motility-associated-like protein
MKIEQHLSSVIKPVFYILFLLLASLPLVAQENLVPNPSFEDYSSCPNTIGSVGDNQLEKALNWYKPNLSTTDYYASCSPQSQGANVPYNWFGYQDAFDGTAYVGIIVYDDFDTRLSEYVQCKLLEPLKSCHRYRVSYRVSLSDYSTRASVIGLRLDKSAISKDLTNWDAFYAFHLPPHIAPPQIITDTSSWILVSGEFIAEGSEQYLTIGRFMDTTVYEEYFPPFVTNDCDSCNTSGVAAQYFVDSVSVIEIGQLENEDSLPNVLTANNDGINDSWYPETLCFQDWQCLILNRWGVEVYSFKDGDIGWNGNDFFGNRLTEGVYFYQIFSEKEEQKQTGFIHLIR